jgi:hypothetical protein
MKTRFPGFLLLNGYFWIAILSIGIFTIPASADSYRLTFALPAVFIISAVGLDNILGMLGWGWEQARTTYASVAAVILVSLLMFNVWAYFVNFAGRCLFGGDDPPARFASFMGNYARNVDMSDEIYLLSDPIYQNGTHQSVAFLSHNRKITNFDQSIEALPARSGEVVIASPNRVPELQAWAQAHPEGKIHTEYDCGNLMLYTYQFP